MSDEITDMKAELAELRAQLSVVTANNRRRPSRIRRGLLFGLAGLALVLGSAAAAPLIHLLLGDSTAAAAPSATPTSLTGVTPARILDTRGTLGGHAGPLGPAGIMTLQATGAGGVPTGATSVALNVTVTDTTGTGYLSLWPTGSSQPTVSTLNWTPGTTLANGATVALSPAGQLNIFNSAGSTDVIVDVTGYYAADPAIATLQTQVHALQTLLSGVTRANDSQGYSTLTFSGMNMQLVNGSGAESSINGLGNLIVGYNDNFNILGRTGSHNLITGDNNGWTSYGGLIGGSYNLTSGIYASVPGGSGNTASNLAASVTGGAGNTASAGYASVTGGSGNTAGAADSSVTGGYTNTASGVESSVTGGYTNTASGLESAITGGTGNTAANTRGVILGGSAGSIPSTAPACTSIPAINTC